MITLSNLEISGFLNPIINNLFDDPERRFPIEDAFKFADLLSQIRAKAQIYQDQVRKIVKNNRGVVDKETKKTDFKDDDSENKAKEEIAILNEIEVEIVGNKIKTKDSWPQLTLNEAYILKPIIES